MNIILMDHVLHMFNVHFKSTVHIVESFYGVL